jgi:2,5-diketo-D-gluconate reductase B
MDTFKNFFERTSIIINLMKYETITNVSIPKIGFGTWRIGGKNYPDPSLDSISMIALRSAIERGYTHFDTAEYYADGHAEELVGAAIRESSVSRTNFFITTKVSPEHFDYDDILKSCEKSLRRLNTDYVDLYLLHWPRVGMNLEEIFRAMNKLVRDGKVKHVGVSNFKMRMLQDSQKFSETPIFTNQIPYSVPDKLYVKNGIVEYCQKNDMLVTAYSPVKFRRINVDKTLNAIAQAHAATTYQIALAWLINQPRVITIPMSFNPKHIRENFEAADIKLIDTEMNRINQLG